MKTKPIVPAFVALAGVAGALLRGWNLIHGYEPVTYLPVRGDVSEFGLIILSAVSLVLLLIWGCSYRENRGTQFEQAFSGGGNLFKAVSVICGLLMCVAGAAGLYTTVSGDPSTPFMQNLPMFPLWILAILTGGCFVGIATALGRNKITESVASLTIIPMFWSCFDLIITYKENGASPFVGLYGFELLAATFMTYAFYVLAGFLYSVGNPARFVFSAGAAIFFLLTCVGGAVFALASGQSVIALPMATLLRYICFLASSLWLLSMLTLLSHSSLEVQKPKAS